MVHPLLPFTTNALDLSWKVLSTVAIKNNVDLIKYRGILNSVNKLRGLFLFCGDWWMLDFRLVFDG